MYRFVIIAVLILYSQVSGFEGGKIDSNVQSDVIKEMRIESLSVVEHFTYLQTTGAIFRIDKNEGSMEIYQRIGKKRKLAEVTISEAILPALRNPPKDTGFDYVWSNVKDKLPRIIISGDSVIRFYNVKRIRIKLYFNPLHRKINISNHGLLALDQEGGIAVMPPDNICSKDYPIKITRTDWELNSNKEMPVLFLGVSPPRAFDWERSRWPVTHYSSHIKRYPADEQIKEYSKFTKVLEMHQWVWKNRYVNKKDCLTKEPYNNCDNINTPLWFDNSYIPVNHKWIPDDEKEFKRVISTAHANGMLVAVYFSGVDITKSALLAEARRLKHKYKIDGLYLDGLLINKKMEGPLEAYLAARDLRRLFGEKGWLNYHNTHDGYFAPFVQTYMDFITTGEHDKFDRWISTTYNISNAIGGHWPEIAYFMPDDSKNIKDARPYLKDLTDISLKYHNRLLFLVGESGQWRFWRLYFTPAEMKFLKSYYLDRLSGN